jgi:hypothetical protein
VREIGKQRERGKDRRQQRERQAQRRNRRRAREKRNGMLRKKGYSMKIWPFYQRVKHRWKKEEGCKNKKQRTEAFFSWKCFRMF